MPTLQACTTRRFLFAASLVVLGGWAVSAEAIDPDSRGSFGGGELAQLPAKTVAAVKPEEKKIRMQKRGELWPATFEWFADLTGMGIVGDTELPTGKFTYTSPGDKDTYTIREILDIINEQLLGQAKPCVLVRGTRQFRLIQLPTAPNIRIDPSVLPRVTPEELNERGETEVVTLDFPLEVLSAEAIGVEYAKPNGLLKKLLSSYGELVPIPGSNQLVLRDQVRNLRNVIYFIRNAEKAEKERGVFTYPCKYIRARDAEKVLKELLGVAPPVGPMPGGPGNPNMGMQPNQGIPGGGGPAQKSVHISSDEGTNSVMVSGPQDKIELAKRALRDLDLPKPNQATVPTGPQETMYYKAPAGNAEALVKSLKELHKPPSVNVVAIGKDGIMVQAFPADQAAIAKFIETSKDQLANVKITLYTLSSKQAVESLNFLFESKTNMAVPTIIADPNDNAIIVRGTLEQIKAVIDALESFGEKSAAGPASRTQRTITLEKGSAATLAQALARMIPQIRKNPIKLMIPGSDTMRMIGAVNDNPNGSANPPANEPKGAGGNGGGQLFDPRAQKAADSNLPALTLTAFGNRLIANCEDPQALDLVQDLTRLLTQTQAGDGDFEVIQLKTARAADAAKLLDEAFNGNKQQKNQDMDRWFFGWGREQKKVEGLIRVVADPSTNSLLVKASPIDMLTIRRMVAEFIDNHKVNAQLIVRQWKLGPLKFTSAKEIYLLIKDIYKEHINNTLDMMRSPAMRNSYFGYGLNLNVDENGQPRKVDLTVSYDDQTNAVFLSCNEVTFKEIKDLVDGIEKDAETSRPTIRVIRLKNIDPDLVQRAIDAMQGKTRPSVKPNGAGQGGQQGTGSSDGSQSRGNDTKDDRHLASLHDPHGGPGFFVQGVKDDPKLSILFDPQQADSSDHSQNTIQLVSYEQMPPGQPPSGQQTPSRPRPVGRAARSAPSRSRSWASSSSRVRTRLMWRKSPS